MRKILFATAMTVVLSPLGNHANAAEAGVKVGALTCNIDSGWGFIIGSSKKIHCDYRPNNGAVVDHYEGSISKFGADIGFTSAGKLVWEVIAPASDIRPGTLQGDYAGATASATAGVGVGANVLVGGMDKSFTLQPVSFEGNTGLNVSGGIGVMSLKSAGTAH